VIIFEIGSYTLLLLLLLLLYPCYLYIETWEWLYFKLGVTHYYYYYYYYYYTQVTSILRTDNDYILNWGLRVFLKMDVAIVTLRLT